jgi:serine/threonine-protein kinase
VDRALALEPELAEAHASRGFLLQQGDPDGPAALAAFRRALELEPSHARTAHWLGGLLMGLGRLEDARVPLERAVELDPTSPVIRLALARWYQFADSPDVALGHARLAARLAPSAPQAQMVVGELLRELGRPGEAQVVLERALGLPGVNSHGFPGLWVELALVYESRGDTARADALLAEVDERASPSAWAAVKAVRGRPDEALALLAGSPVVTDFSVILRYHHVFDALRGEPAFQDLLDRYDRAWGLGGGPRTSP